MAGNHNLSIGSVNSLMAGNSSVTSAVFQILGFKKLAGQSGGHDRFRLNISDGIHSHTFAMLATQLNHLVPEGKIDNNCIIRADKIISNDVSEKRVLIIIELTVLTKGTEVGSRIGNPVQWTSSNASLAPSIGNGPANNNTAPKAATATTNAFSHTNGSSKTANKPTTPMPMSAIANKKPVTPGLSVPTSAIPTSSMPIRDITPYSNRSIIRARVTRKTDIRHWSNSKGEGKLFSMDLLDESGEIRATGFNTQVDQFYEFIETNNVYYIEKFQVKPANKQFNTCAHDYEITLSNDTVIFPCQTDTEEIPTITFNFVPISSIANLEKDKIIDVLGVCKNVGDVETLITKATNKELRKREIVLVDQSNSEINVTIWGKSAEEYNDHTQPVIAIKGARVSDFNGKSLSLLHSSIFQLNPDIREAHVLRGWFDNEGMNVQTQSLTTAGGRAGTKWKIIKETTNPNTPIDDKGDFFMSKVTLLAIKRDNCVYMACPAPNCNKKVIDNNNGMYRCEKCNKEYPEFKWRYMVLGNFGDFSDSTWASCFSETSELILGTSADVFGPMVKSDNTTESEQADAILKEAVFTDFICKFKAKMDNYNGEPRKKVAVVDINRVNHVEYAKKLINEIKEII